MSETKKKKKPVVGLALGGGGARGFAHIGVLRAFEEYGFNFDMCIGTSVGSLIGAFYASKVPYNNIRRLAEEIEMPDVHSRFLLYSDDSGKVGRVAERLCGKINIEDMPIKYGAVATNMQTGRIEFIDSGPMCDAVAASCAFPIAYKPVVLNGKNLCDGGLLDNVPTDVCKYLGADKVVGVDIFSDFNGGGTEGTNIFSVIKSVIKITMANSSLRGRIQADVLISPDTSAFSPASKNGYREMIQAGYSAALLKCDEIKKLFEE